VNEHGGNTNDEQRPDSGRHDFMDCQCHSPSPAHSIQIVRQPPHRQHTSPAGALKVPPAP
jgi:hypothetical protein